MIASYNGFCIHHAIDKESFVDGQQECMMADGSVIKTALAKVYIDSPYFVGEVIAWCMQNPLYDAIIGNVEGARDPNDPELNHEVGVVTGLQAKKMAQRPYRLSNACTSGTVINSVGPFASMIINVFSCRMTMIVYLSEPRPSIIHFCLLP
jgi:hypothetical protein